VYTSGPGNFVVPVPYPPDGSRINLDHGIGQPTCEGVLGGSDPTANVHSGTDGLFWGIVKMFKQLWGRIVSRIAGD